MGARPNDTLTPASLSTIFTSCLNRVGREEVTVTYVRKGGTPVPPSHRRLTPEEEEYKADMIAGRKPKRPIPSDGVMERVANLRALGETWDLIGEKLGRNPSWLCYTFNDWQRRRNHVA